MILNFPPEFSVKQTPFLFERLPRRLLRSRFIDFNRFDHGIKAAIDQSHQLGFLQLSGGSGKRQRQYRS